MADYSAMKYYLEKYNLHYFTLSPNSEKPMKLLIHHLPQDKPAEDISNSPEDLGCNVINMRQVTATQIAPSGQTDMETPPSIPCYLSKEHSISRDMQAEQLELRHTLCSDTTAKTLAMPGPIASNPLDICDAVLANCIWNALKTQIQNLC
jgi:hypothetical protein